MCRRGLAEGRKVERNGKGREPPKLPGGFFPGLWKRKVCLGSHVRKMLDSIFHVLDLLLGMAWITDSFRQSYDICFFSKTGPQASY